MEVSIRFDDEDGNAARIRAYGSALEEAFVVDMKRVGRGENPNFEISHIEAVKLRSVLTSYLLAAGVTLPASADDAGDETGKGSAE